MATYDPYQQTAGGILSTVQRRRAPTVAQQPYRVEGQPGDFSQRAAQLSGGSKGFDMPSATNFGGDPTYPTGGVRPPATFDPIRGYNPAPVKQQPQYPIGGVRPPAKYDPVRGYTTTPTKSFYEGTGGVKPSMPVRQMPGTFPTATTSPVSQPPRYPDGSKIDGLSMQPIRQPALPPPGTFPTATTAPVKNPGRVRRPGRRVGQDITGQTLQERKRIAELNRRQRGLRDPRVRQLLAQRAREMQMQERRFAGGQADQGSILRELLAGAPMYDLQGG